MPDIKLIEVDDSDEFWRANAGSPDVTRYCRSAITYEDAVKQAADNGRFPNFDWNANNPHVTATPAIYGDRSAIEICYDVKYYQGPTSPKGKYAALEATIYEFADIYNEQHPDKRVRIKLEPVNIKKPDEYWPTVVYSTPNPE